MSDCVGRLNVRSPPFTDFGGSAFWTSPGLLPFDRRGQMIQPVARAFVVVGWMLAAPAVAAVGRPSVAVHHGDIEFRDGKGSSKQLTSGGKAEDPVLSPDGRTVAWVQVDNEAIASDQQAPHEPGATSLWICDGPTGTARKLAGDLTGKDREAVIQNPSKASFSLDGGFLYVESDLATTSGGVHQLNLTTGKHRFVVAGELKGVIRSGPYRGLLIVSEHRFLDAPLPGASYPFLVVRPDGKEIMTTPVRYDYRDPAAIDRWLKAKGWRVW